MDMNPGLKPFENCPPLDGYHCQTNSLAKIFHYYSHPLSEDMLFGLGAGMGFIYWKMNMGTSAYVFIGGRGNNKDFFSDLGKRTGVKISVIPTSSVKRAESSLLEKLAVNEPVMLFGDMGFLPWFELPEDYHFGGHTFVVCGYDGENTVLASDMEQKATGLKKGFYAPVTLERLQQARSSVFKPFPPKNTYLEFDFSGYRDPGAESIYPAIGQLVESQLNPPIKNLGIRGIRHTAGEILKWPGLFSENELRLNLFSIYIYFEIGGTGGGCFRYMYSRFLKEAAAITGNTKLLPVADQIHQAGEIFTEIGLLFKNAAQDDELSVKIQAAAEKFKTIADLEEAACTLLGKIMAG